MKINRDILKELRYISKLESCKERLQEYLKELTPDDTITTPQFSALHVACKFGADALNDSGKDMKTVLKQEVNIPWTTDSFKEYIFKPVMTALTGKTSTKQLKKDTGEVDLVWKVIMRELGEKHGIEYIPFPSKETQEIGKIDYPEDYEEPAI